MARTTVKRTLPASGHDVVVHRNAGIDVAPVVLEDSSGNEVSVATQATLASALTQLQSILADLQNKADLGETQPVSVASLPLPTGASTDAGVAALLVELQSILAELEAKADLAETQPVSAVSLPLPAGASTETTLAALLTELTNAGVLANGAETSVSGTAVEVLSANASRKKMLIQNVGSENVRIGIASVTATTGMKLLPNGHLLDDGQYVHRGAVFAIRESADSIVLAQEWT